MVLVQKNVAHPWMCDVLGHMTTRHYVAMFDDAAYHMLYLSLIHISEPTRPY